MSESKSKRKRQLTEEEFQEMAEKRGFIPEDLTEIDLQKLAYKRGFILTNRTLGTKIYHSVRCNGGCGHIFRSKWSKHVDSTHDGENPGFTPRLSEGGLQ